MAVGQISSLAVWAQKYIAELAEDAARAQQSLTEYMARETATLEESTVIADPYGGCPRPLGKDTRIHFTNGDITFAVEFDSADGSLDITVSGRRANADYLAVHPQSGNAVRLSGGRP